MKREYKDIELLHSELESELSKFQRSILEKGHQVETLKNDNENELDTIFKDLISVIDSFDKADSKLAEQFSDDENVEKARKRFATSKKKLMEILTKNGVSEIQFPDGVAVLEDCLIQDAVPDADKPNDTIVSILKAGYRRNGRLLRSAEVVIVKN